MTEMDEVSTAFLPSSTFLLAVSKRLMNLKPEAKTLCKFDLVNALDDGHAFRGGSSIGVWGGPFAKKDFGGLGAKPQENFS